MSISANELRLGNRINFNVQGIEYGIGKITAIEKDFVRINAIKLQNLDRLAPISLTEEILLKCGFKPTSEDFFKIEIYKKCWLEINLKDKRTIIFLYGCQFVELKFTEYLHQLQNLYMCLCGKELEINL